MLVGNWPSDTGYAWKMIERFWIAIAQEFPDRKTILCFPKVTTVSPALSAAGIAIREFDFRRPAALYEFCRTNDIGLIYLTDHAYASGVYPRLRRCGVSRIAIHDHTPGQRTRPSAPKRLAKTAWARWFGADAYIACSEHVLNRLTEVGCISAQRCHLARNGIDLSRFPAPHSSIRGELALLQPTLLVVSSSRLHPYKRVADIVEAAALLTDLDVHFIHVGGGPELPSLQTHIRDRGLTNRFTLLGQRDDVPNILAGCDIAVHASSGEVGLSLSILEFMASRLAVIVTDEPSVGRIIDEGRTGLTFAHGNVAALAAGMRRLVTDAGLRARLGEAAREAVASHYRIEDTVTSVVEVIRGLVQ